VKAGRVALVFLAAATLSDAAAPQQDDAQALRFKTGIELINVTATVTDKNGRFVPDLAKEDFRIFEDGVEQEIAQFDAERVPVSLGLVVDTSLSMEGERWQSARAALNTFLLDLLDERDEVFLYRFDTVPELVEGWTTDRLRAATGLQRIRPRGATALYDAVSVALPTALRGRHRKKALLVISDGNDTNSKTPLAELREQIRKTELLVYTIGIETPQNDFLMTARRAGAAADPVNISALRDISDDSGGRTEIIHHARDLGPATQRIANELSRQYYIGYRSQGKTDGRFHTIRVEVRGGHRVRARRGYMAPQ
jgi:Ca-activated chloride channel family protein